MRFSLMAYYVAIDSIDPDYILLGYHIFRMSA